jgi:hypothetical protein
MSSVTGYGSQSKTVSGIVSVLADTLQAGNVVMSGSTISGIGTVTASNMNASNLSVSANSSLSAVTFSGNISQNSGYVSSLRTLTVNGTCTTSRLLCTGNANISGLANIMSNLAVNNLITANTISVNTITGSLTTASQPNITSVGTLTSLTVSGALSANTLGGTLTTASQPNITSVGTLGTLSVTGNITQSSGTSNLQTINCSDVYCTGNVNSLCQTTANLNEVSLTGSLRVLTQSLSFSFPSSGTFSDPYTVGDWTAQSSSYRSSVYYAYKAFDSNSTTSWLSDGNYYSYPGGGYTGSTSTASVNGEWLQIKNNRQLFTIQSVSFTVGTGSYKFSAKTYTCLGSLDGSTWVSLGTGTATATSWTSSLPYYKMYYFRVVCTSMDDTKNGISQNASICDCVITGRFAEGTFTCSGNATIGGDTVITGNCSVSGNATLIGSQAFGSNIGNKLFLYSTTYGLGISASQQNYWSGGSHVFYVGGANNSGTEKLRVSSTAVTITNDVQVTGNLRLSNPTCATWSLSGATQSISNITDTKVVFGVTNYFVAGLTSLFKSTGGNFQNASVESRYFLITYSVTWAANSTNSRNAYIQTDANCTPASLKVGYSACAGAGGGGITALSGSCVIQMDSGAYIQLYVYQNSGGALNITNTGTYLSFVEL